MNIYLPKSFILKIAKFSVKRKLKHSFWLDNNLNFREVNDISDEELKNIIKEISDLDIEYSGRLLLFIDKKKINKIFEEAYSRNILRPDILLGLNMDALYKFGYEEKPSRFEFDEAGNYVER